MRPFATVMQQPDLLTDRLLLRPFRLNDAPEVRRLAGNINVAKTTLNIPHPYAKGEAEAWIRSHEAHWHARTLVAFAIVQRESDQLMGTISLTQFEQSAANLGYWLGEPYWGQGYCSEAARAVFTFALETLRLHKVKAEHLAINPASGRVMEKAGMQHTGNKQGPDRHGDMVEVLTYEMTLTRSRRMDKLSSRPGR